MEARYLCATTKLAATKKGRFSGVAGIGIGLSLLVFYVIDYGFTGASLNPARSLAPAIFTGGTSLTNVWVFLVGPLVGAVLAAFLYKFFAKGMATDESAH